MKKLPIEERTRKFGVNVNELLLAEFYLLAKQFDYVNREGKFFEKIFKEWKVFKARQSLTVSVQKKPGSRKTVEQAYVLPPGIVPQGKTGTHS